MEKKYFLIKLISKFFKNRHEYISNFFRKQGIQIGNGCNICSNILTTESYLISIGNNVTISTEVLLLTHDASVGKVFNKQIASDIIGKIIIGDNCFIGARSTILPGVTIANNIIVAAGSVVTKSFIEEKIIIGGNPAKKIGTWENYAVKVKDYTYSIHGKKGKAAREIIEKREDRLVVK